MEENFLKQEMEVEQKRKIILDQIRKVKNLVNFEEIQEHCEKVNEIKK